MTPLVKEDREYPEGISNDGEVEKESNPYNAKPVRIPNEFLHEKNPSFDCLCRELLRPLIPLESVVTEVSLHA